MEAATGALRRSASSAWRAALSLARRRLDLWLPAGVAALAAATLAYGWIARASGVRLGAGLAPLLADWRPLLRPSALPAIVLLAGGVAAAPRLRSGRVRPGQFALAALGLGLALRLALGMARGGADGLYAVYELGNHEAASEYLPALPAFEFGTRFFLDTFAEIGASLPVHAIGHPPGLLVTVHWLGIDDAPGMAALTIGVGALSIPPRLSPRLRAARRAAGPDRHPALRVRAERPALWRDLGGCPVRNAGAPRRRSPRPGRDPPRTGLHRDRSLRLRHVELLLLCQPGGRRLGRAARLAARRPGASGDARRRLRAGGGRLLRRPPPRHRLRPDRRARCHRDRLPRGHRRPAAVRVLAVRLAHRVPGGARPPDLLVHAALCRRRRPRRPRPPGRARDRRAARLRQGRDRAHLPVSRSPGLRRGGRDPARAAPDAGPRCSGHPGACHRAPAVHGLVSVVLVTGGAGFIGSHLVDALLEGGERVRVLDNLDELAHPSGRPSHLRADAELIVGDLRDRETVERALVGVDRIFHLGGVVGNGESMINARRAVDNNAGGTATLLEAAQAPCLCPRERTLRYGRPACTGSPSATRGSSCLCSAEPMASRPWRCATWACTARARRWPTPTPAWRRSSPLGC